MIRQISILAQLFLLGCLILMSPSGKAQEVKFEKFESEEESEKKKEKMETAPEQQPVRVIRPPVTGEPESFETPVEKSEEISTEPPAPAPEVEIETEIPIESEQPIEPAPTPTPSPEPTTETTAPPVEKEPSQEVEAKPSRRFIKGDLIYPGTRRLLSRFDHIGVSVGVSFVDNDLLATVSPGMAWYFDSGWAVSFHMPVRLLALEINGDEFEFGGLKVRRQDWDEISDFAKVIRFITFGRKESNLYFTINTMRPTTIGHGMLMNNYQGDIDVDRSLTSLIFDAYNDYAGFQLQANDITFQNQILAGLAFFKPLSFFSDSTLAKGFSLGVEYITDLRAPRCILESATSDNCVQGSGHAAGFNPYNGESLDNSFVRTDPDTGRFAAKETMVHAIGGSFEFKFYKGESADLKLYATYHQFLNDGGGGGLAGGTLARINVGQTWISAFRLRGEYQTFEDGFLPSYFNTLYEIQKYAFLYAAKNYQVGPTKYQQVFGDPENGFNRVDHGRRHGYRLDLHWALFKTKRSAKKIGLGLGIQDSNGPYDTNFYLHLECPLLAWLQIFGTYMKNNVDGVDQIFTNLTGKDAIILTGFRLQVLPILFVNAHYSQSFRAVGSPGSEVHLGNDTIVDASGNVSPYFKQDLLFENVHTFFVDVEFGWEFDEDNN
jgi:hypothetical protein